MTIYCFNCCDYCKEYEVCGTRDGGCEKCEYWLYGECSNPHVYNNRVSKIQSKYGRNEDYATPLV